MDFTKYKSEYIKGDHEGNRRRNREAIDLFKKDLSEEFGVKGKMLDVIFEYAWQEGHHGGFYEVYGHFEELEKFADNIIAAYKEGK